VMPQILTQVIKASFVVAKLSSAKPEGTTFSRAAHSALRFSARLKAVPSRIQQKPERICS